MKKKLIHSVQEIFLQCDNPICDYTLKEKDQERTQESYINEPCPICQSNLLTKGDYLRLKKMTDWVNWINKWFGWLGSYPNDSKNQSVAKIDFHQRIKITATKKPNL